MNAQCLVLDGECNTTCRSAISRATCAYSSPKGVREFTHSRFSSHIARAGCRDRRTAGSLGCTYKRRRVKRRSSREPGTVLCTACACFLSKADCVVIVATSGRCDDLILRPLFISKAVAALLYFLLTIPADTPFSPQAASFFLLFYVIFPFHSRCQQKIKSKQPHPSSPSSPPPKQRASPKLTRALFTPALPFRRFLRASTLFQRIDGNPVRFWCGCGGRANPNRSWSLLN